MNQLQGLQGDIHHQVDNLEKSPEKLVQNVEAKVDDVKVQIEQQIPEISKQIVNDLNELESFLKEFKDEHIKQGQLTFTDKEQNLLNHQIQDLENHNDLLQKYVGKITKTFKGLKTIEEKKKDLVTKQGKQQYNQAVESFENQIVQDVMLELAHKNKESRGEKRFHTITSFIPAVMILICQFLEYYRSIEVIDQVDEYLENEKSKDTHSEQDIQLVEDFRFDVVTLQYLSIISFLAILTFKIYFILCHALNYIDIDNEKEVKKAGIKNIFWKYCEKFTDISIAFVFVCMFTCFIFWWVTTILEYNQDRKFDDDTKYLIDKKNDIYSNFYDIIKYSSYMPIIVYIPLQIVFAILSKIIFKKKKQRKQNQKSKN